MHTNLSSTAEIDEGPSVAGRKPDGVTGLEVSVRPACIVHCAQLLGNLHYHLHAGDVVWMLPLHVLTQALSLFGDDHQRKDALW